MLRLQYAMQVLGLKWVSANIDLLGGDPSRVTVLGSGKAATTAALHLLSPLSCNLFTRIILQVSRYRRSSKPESLCSLAPRRPRSR